MLHTLTVSQLMVIRCLFKRTVDIGCFEMVFMVGRVTLSALVEEMLTCVGADHAKLLWSANVRGQNRLFFGLVFFLRLVFKVITLCLLMPVARNDPVLDM